MALEVSTTIVFDKAAFRAMFPLFADPAKYPDAVLDMFWEQAICVIDNEVLCGCAAKCRKLALYYLVAHFLSLNDAINGGQPVGIVQSSTIDKISVTMAVPPTRNEFRFWLAATPFGQTVLALLSAKSVGGFYFGGRPESAAFRKVGGKF